MPKPRTLPAFTEDQLLVVHRLLATRVAFMMGRKFEEGDWAHVYCTAKNIPIRGWSNLRIDVMYRGIGIEHKMLARPAEGHISDAYGTRLSEPCY